MRTLHFNALTVALVTVACGTPLSTTQDASLDAGQGPLEDAAILSDGGGRDSGAIDGGLSAFDAGAVSDAGTVSVITDLRIRSFPHQIDVYVPSGATRVVVFLHGGGGNKDLAASRESGIRLDDPPQAVPVPDTSWLLANRTAWVFPQGQHIAGALLAKTWSNYMMVSGEDDVAFLNGLAAALRAGSLASSVPAFTRVYLAGHSNGGLMAVRQWCESTVSFDGYGSLSGPPSTELLPDGGHPCAPSAARPFLAVIGSDDTVLQTKNNWSGTWSVNACLQNGAGAAMPNPFVANEEPFHQLVRVPRLCGGPPAAAQATASATTWSDCGGKVKLIRVEGADHCVAATTNDACVGSGTGGGCPNSLDGQYGTRMRQVLVDFFVGTEP